MPGRDTHTNFGDIGNLVTSSVRYTGLTITGFINTGCVLAGLIIACFIEDLVSPNKRRVIERVIGFINNIQLFDEWHDILRVGILQDQINVAIWVDFVRDRSHDSFRCLCSNVAQ